MSSEATLKRLREQHKKLRFPGELAGADVDGECLLLLDTDAVGCIQCFFSGNKGSQLDANRIQILERCAASLARICPQIAEEHRPYFESLRTLAEGIVRYCHRQ